MVKKIKFTYVNQYTINNIIFDNFIKETIQINHSVNKNFNNVSYFIFNNKFYVYREE